MKKIATLLLTLLSLASMAQMTLYSPTKSITLCKLPASESYMPARAAMLLEVWNETTNTLLLRRWDKDGGGLGENNHPTGSEISIPVGVTIKVVVYNLSLNKLPMQVVIYNSDIYPNVYTPVTFPTGIVDGSGSLSGGSTRLYKQIIGGESTVMKFTSTSKSWWKINLNCMFYSSGTLVNDNPNNGTDYGANFYNLTYTPSVITWDSPLVGTKIQFTNTTSWNTHNGTATNPFYSNVVATTVSGYYVDAGGKLAYKSGSKYAKVYKRKVGGSIKFTWHTTDQNGNRLPRGGQVKNTPVYTSLSGAEAAPPTGYDLITTSPNAIFENTILPTLMDGGYLLADNQLGLSIFPTTPVEANNNFTSGLIWGDAPVFRGNAQQMLSLGLADGFDHNRAFNTTEMPTSNRYTWNIAPDAFASGSLSTIEANGAGDYTNMTGTRRDKAGNPVLWKYTHWDLETPAWSVDKVVAFLKGYHNAATAVDANHVTIFYGKPIREFKPMWRMATYYYDGDAVNNRMKVFPFLKSGTNYQTNSGLVDSYFANKNIYLPLLPNYPSGAMPMTTSFYQKSSGVIQTEDGERKFITNAFNEVINGKTYTWVEARPADPEPPNQGPYKSFMHEAFLAVYAPLSFYANAVYELRVLAGGNDLTNVLNGSYKTHFMLRTTHESNPWQNAYRPLDPYMTKVTTLLGYAMANKVVLWSGWTGTWGLTDNGLGIYPISNEGTGLAQGDIEGYGSATPKNVNLTAERQILGLTYRIKQLSRDYGFFGTTDKLCTFTDPLAIQSRAELMAVGRIQGDKLWLVVAEPRHDIGESTVITVGTTKNSYTHTFTLAAKQIREIIVDFPDGTYNPNEVWTQYTTIKGNNVKTSGDLREHDK